MDDCVIVLNKYDEYWAEMSTRRALRKILSDRAVPVKEDRSDLLGAIKLGWGPDAKYKPIYRPLIIRLSHFDYYYYKSDKVPYSDNAVFLRDKSICQYWHYEDGKKIMYKCHPSELTIDHVQPVSREGKTNDFLNAVCACRHCNEIIKKNMTPEEAGLELIREPKVPKRITGDRARAFFAYDPKKKAHQAYNEFISS